MCGTRSDDPTQHDIEDALVAEDIPERRAREYRLIYAGGEERTVRATSAKSAILLAGRGQPEQIDDMTLLPE